MRLKEERCFFEIFLYGILETSNYALLFKSFSNSILGVLIKREQKISFLIFQNYKTGRIAGYTYKSTIFRSALK
jgi:hypothetical protein